MDKTKYDDNDPISLLVSINEASVRDLETNIQRGFPNTTKRQYAVGPVQIPIVKLTPYVPSKSLFIEAQANSNGRRYSPEILFDSVDYEQEETQTNVTFTGSDNNEYNMTQAVPLTGNQVKVRCNCLDFHYRFALQNARDGSLYGPPPPNYQRKTETRPPVNPMKVPGMCKHLLKLVDELQKSKMVQPG